MINIKEDIQLKLKKYPDDYDLNLQLGLIFISNKDYSKAKIIFKKLIFINKSRFEGYLNLSNIFGINNKFDESEKILKKFIKKNNYNKQIVSGLATLYYNTGNYKKLKILVNQYLNIEENHIIFFLKAFLHELEQNSEKQII